MVDSNPDIRWQFQRNQASASAGAGGYLWIPTLLLVDKHGRVWFFYKKTGPPWPREQRPCRWDPSRRVGTQSSLAGRNSSRQAGVHTSLLGGLLPATWILNQLVGRGKQLESDIEHRRPTFRLLMIENWNYFNTARLAKLYWVSMIIYMPSAMTSMDF
jgi:hypothetical protein